MGDGADDAYDRALCELESSDYCEELIKVQCAYCKRKGLYWQETERGWRLATPNGKLHECSWLRQLRESLKTANAEFSGGGYE